MVTIARVLNHSGGGVLQGDAILETHCAAAVGDAVVQVCGVIESVVRFVAYIALLQLAELNPAKHAACKWRVGGRETKREIKKPHSIRSMSSSEALLCTWTACAKGGLFVCTATGLSAVRAAPRRVLPQLPGQPQVRAAATIPG